MLVAHYSGLSVYSFVFFVLASTQIGLEVEMCYPFLIILHATENTCFLCNFLELQVNAGTASGDAECSVMRIASRTILMVLS